MPALSDAHFVVVCARSGSVRCSVSKSFRLLLSVIRLAVGALLGILPLLYAQNTQPRGVLPEPLQPGSPGQQRGAYYALVIGINGYQHLPPLQTPLNDAAEIASTLSLQYGFNTQLLRDATRDQILRALGDYRGKLHESDSLLIYYAGHGYYDRDADEAYWFPVDAEKNNPARWIVATEITGQARAIPARHVLVVSDSCYSGMLTRDVRPTLGDPGERDVYLQKLMQGKSRYVMASGGNEPVADSDTAGHPSNHSVFASALLHGLNEIKLNEFSAEELFNQFVREQVGGRSRQLPEYNPIRDSGHDSGAFVFFRSGAAPPWPPGVSPAVKRDAISVRTPPSNPAADAVLVAIRSYADAYASMDVHELQKVWPSLSKAQINELKRGFRGAQAVKVDLQQCDPVPGLNGDTAQVRCDQSMEYTRDGKRQAAETHPVDILLRKSANGTWLVDEVRAR
jgi:hypothetical protein